MAKLVECEGSLKSLACRKVVWNRDKLEKIKIAYLIKENRPNQLSARAVFATHKLDKK